MSRQGKWEYLKAIHPRYRQASRAEKGRILDEFCRVMGDVVDGVDLLVLPNAEWGIRNAEWTQIRKRTRVRLQVQNADSPPRTTGLRTTDQCGVNYPAASCGASSARTERALRGKPRGIDPQRNEHSPAALPSVRPRE